MDWWAAGGCPESQGKDVKSWEDFEALWTAFTSLYAVDRTFVVLCYIDLIDLDLSVLNESGKVSLKRDPAEQT
jgi:hypothetical protein